MAKKIFALFLVVISLLSCMILPASAATYSSGTSTRTITVTTKANWAVPGSESITLSQSKGKFTYSKTDWLGRTTGKTGSKSEYGTWKISVSATDGSHSFSKTWKDGSIKLDLKPNKTYRITISYDGIQDTFRALDYRNFRWSSYPSWRVKSTWKVSSYY
jgi:hypothetical protein